MMNLKLVTWDGDLTQFLVEATSSIDAVKKAIESNLILGNDEECGDLHDARTYIVEDVNLALLNEIIHRDDYIGIYGNAIVFNN